MTSQTDRLTRRIDFAYDADDRLTTQTWYNAGGSGPVNTLVYSYDAVGNLLTGKDADGRYTYTYDSLDRVATQKDLFSMTLTFTYDAVGNRTQVQDNLGGYTTSVYDNADRLTSRKFSNGTTPLVSFRQA